MRRPDGSKTLSALVRATTLCGVLFATGCYSTGEGSDPPRERIYFPVGLALANDSQHLVVLNSDFDLQYNAGTMQVLDLRAARASLPQPCDSDAWCGEGRVCDTASSGLCVDATGPNAGAPCGALAERSLSDQLLYPGRCEAIDPARPPTGESWIVDAVEIGAFATDIVYRSRPVDAPPGEPGRIFFPVRGDATLHWADVRADGRIECGQAQNDGACDGNHRAGDDPDRENNDDLRLESEPFGLDASADGRAIVVTHQTGHSLSVFDNAPWSEAGPYLVDTLPQVGRRPVGVASVPAPAIVAARGDYYVPGFLVTFRAEPFVGLVRYSSDIGAEHPRPVLSNAGRSNVFVNSVGTDARGLAIDDAARRSAEAECFARAGIDVACGTNRDCVGGLDAAVRDALLACLDEAAAFGLGVYVASRAPESLLVGRTTPAINYASSTDLPAFTETVRLPFGPSRVVFGDVIVGGTREEPVFEPRVFVVCFDARRIIVYDPARRQVDFEIETGRGPHGVAVDARDGLLFLGHFTDSYLGVVSLDRRFPRTYGTFLATIGKPSPPRASK